MYNGKSQLASEQLHQATSLNPTGLPAWESLAALQLNCGEVTEAAETYEKLVSPPKFHPWPTLYTFLHQQHVPRRKQDTPN